MTSVPRVAVLGGTGSVGRHVCAEFANQGYEVVVIARTPSTRMAPYRFVPMDIADTDAELLAKFLATEGFSVVVNAAGSWSNSADELTYAHVTLLERLVAGVSAVPARPRLVHIGTVHEYGPQPHGTSMAEDTETLPQTDFARTKLASSQLVLDAARAGEVDGVVLRVSNVYGPDPAAGSFLGFLSAKLGEVDPATGIELTIADARRDYVDSRDVARAVVLAARLPVRGQVFNIGSGAATSMRDLVYALVRAAGLPESAVRERAAPIQSKGGDWTQVDTTRAQHVLGWHPEFTLPESVRAMWETR